MWFTLGRLALKTGAEIYKNKKKAQLLESEAEVKHMERAIKGEVEWKQQVISSQKNDLKDEIVLCLISIPLLIAGWGVFSEDPEIINKLDMFFEQINNFPLWLQGLIIGGYSTVLGIKGVNTFKKKYFNLISNTYIVKYEVRNRLCNYRTYNRFIN